MLTEDWFRPEWPSNALEAERTIPQRRRQTLATVRWVFIALCAFLIVRNPGSGSILAPLLLLAIFLGRRRGPQLARTRAVVGPPRARRAVTLH
jgi:hypothetical protein